MAFSWKKNWLLWKFWKMHCCYARRAVFATRHGQHLTAKSAPKRYIYINYIYIYMTTFARSYGFYRRSAPLPWKCLIASDEQSAHEHINYWCHRWRHSGRDSVSNHQPHHCLLNLLFRRRSKKTSKLRVTGLCARNSPGTGEFPAQMASNAENVSIWWRHHASGFRND